MYKNFYVYISISLFHFQVSLFIYNDVVLLVGYLLDPHTSIAKTVADRQTTSERPMIICSTAHYGKFPEDVSRALQLPLPAENDDCSGVLQQLKTVSALPSFNQGLESAVKKPRVHNSVISDDMKNITREIETFCAEW